jgi:hypothetical protein
MTAAATSRALVALLIVAVAVADDGW